MPRLRIIFVLLAVVNFPQVAGAGLYSAEMPPSKMKIPRKGVRGIPPDRFYQNYLLEQKKDLLPEFVKRKEALERRPKARWTVEDRINLSYYLIRLNQVVDAIGVLRDPQAQNARHFMVYANLGTAFMIKANGEPPRERMRTLDDARTYLDEALRPDVWPKEWSGWSKEQLDWFRQVEQAQKQLARLRWKEAIKQVRNPPKKDSPPFEKVDALFPVEFDGAGGRFEKGKIAPAEKAKLKGQEILIVQQLLAWMPLDYRLAWLFAELNNANGDAISAFQVMDSCMRDGGLSQVTLLRDHLRILQEVPAAPPSKSWAPETWQLFLVGGGAACIICLLAYWQIREMRRRRQSAKS